MKEILILSGKGGAGKTSITACFARLADHPVLVDCDVDASNLPMLLSPSDTVKEEFYAGVRPVADPAKCTLCGLCRTKCRFDAVVISSGAPVPVFADSCEGCGLCAHCCPATAISLAPRLCGHAMRSRTPYGELFHAELLPGGENSGKLIAELRRRARAAAEAAGASLIISDGPPGIGCPVISAATGVDHAVIVTEPTVSGIHDMERLAVMLRQFEIPFSLIINKAGINLEKCRQLEEWAAERQIKVLGKIPFDRLFPRALSRLECVLDHPESPIPELIKNIWQKVQEECSLN